MAGLVPLVIATAVTVGIGGFLTMRRLVPSLEAHADSRSLSSAFSMSAGLFSFVLAFTIGQLYGNFKTADNNAKKEATAIEQVLRVSKALPPALATALRRETLEYARDVRVLEWPKMAHGKYSVQAWRDIDRMYATLERNRAQASSNPYFAQASSRIDALVDARQTRLDDANLSIPTLFKALLGLGAVLAIFGTFYFKPLGERIQVVMIGAASTLVGIALLVAITLDYPYSGSIAVSSTPFQQSTLLLLSGGR